MVKMIQGGTQTEAAEFLELRTLQVASVQQQRDRLGLDGRRCCVAFCLDGAAKRLNEWNGVEGGQRLPPARRDEKLCVAVLLFDRLGECRHVQGFLVEDAGK